MSGALSDLAARVWALLQEWLETFKQLLAERLPVAVGGDRTVELDGRRFRIVKQLGEGGYAFVYLVRELPTARRPLVEDQPLALKRVVASSRERLAEANREVATMRALAHPSCLPLLAHATLPAPGGQRGGGGGGGGGASMQTAAGGFQLAGGGDAELAGSGGGAVALLLFPAYEDGTLAEEVARLAAAGRRLGSADVLDIFEQVCAGVAHMHARGLAHRDVKPHNVLIERPRSSGDGGAKGAAGRGRGVTSVFSDEEGAGSGGEDADAAERGQLLGDDAGGGSQRRRHRRRRDRYGAVLMDFGSARPAAAEVTNRMDALALQEDAEAHCTGTYRAPELFDVCTHALIDGRVDAWSLGCTLYHMMYGASPFQEALDRGASLPLAVLNCRIPWPKPPAPRYPQQLHDLVAFCLQPDPRQRPTAEQLLARVAALRRLRLPDAAPAPAGAGAEAAAGARTGSIGVPAGETKAGGAERAGRPGSAVLQRR